MTLHRHPTAATHSPDPSVAAEYFERRRAIAAAAKRAGHVGAAVPLDPHS